MGWRAISLSVTMLMALSSCAELAAEFSDRNGPNAIADPQSEDDAASRELNVVAALAKRANVTIPPNSSFPVANSDWYQVILTGFNVADDACEAYIDNIWRLDRQRNTAKTLITSTGAAVAAIIGTGHHPSAAALGTLAAAFGLGIAATDAIANTYLFNQPPTVIKQLVKTATDAYRQELIGGKGANPSYSAPLVYYHVRQYISLCLPSSIDAQVSSYVAKAGAHNVNNPASPSGLLALRRPLGAPHTPDPSSPINIQLFSQ